MARNNVLNRLFADKDVPLDPAQHPQCDCAQLRVRHAPMAVRAENDQIIIVCPDVINQFPPVPAFERDAGKGNTVRLAERAQDIEIRLGDEPESLANERIMGGPLFFQCVLVLVWLGQAALHGSETLVMQAGGIDVTASDLRVLVPGDENGKARRGVGQCRTVKRNVDFVVANHCFRLAHTCEPESWPGRAAPRARLPDPRAGALPRRESRRAPPVWRL